MPQPGQVIAGKYLLDKLIGQGAFATVWAATNTYIDRAVALKILAEAPARKPSTVARFLKEAKLCATPIHPTIVQVEDMGQTEEGLPFLVMELLEGHTLDRVLRTKGALPWSMVLAISRNVLEGLSAAHERDIIHRDIKPSNLFLVRSLCGGPPVRVLDLGLARDLAEENRLTRTGQVVGTANYLPPETLLDETPKGGTKQGDVFAMGMVMFVALTGRFPFVADKGRSNPAAEVYARAKFYKSREPLPGPADYNREVPAPLDVVVRRALEVDRRRRFADTTQMLGALLGALAEIAPRESRVSLDQSLAATRFSPPPECDEIPGELALAPARSPSLETWEALLDFSSAHMTPPPPGLAQTSVARPILAIDADPGRLTPESGSPSPSLSPRPSAGASPRDSLPSRPSGQRSSRSEKPTRPSKRGSLKGSRIGLILIGSGAGALVGLAILAAIALWLTHSRSQALIVTQPVRPQVADLVEVELQGLPAESVLRLDGEVSASPILRGVSGRRSRLDVSAPGYQPLSFEVTFEAGQVIDLAPRLRRLLPSTEVGPGPTEADAARPLETSRRQRRGPLELNSEAAGLADPWAR